MIKGVYFDWGGVLIENPAIPLLEYIAEYFNVTKVEMRQLFDDNHEIMEKYQTGLIDESEIWSIIFNKPNCKVWSDAVKNCFKVHQEVVDYAINLKKIGYKIGILSNTELETVENFPTILDENIFNYQIFSCCEHSAKPDRLIYENAVELMGLPANEILFIDDRDDFIQGAKLVGMHTFHFPSLEKINKLKNYKKLLDVIL